MNYGEHPTSAPDGGTPQERLQELLATAEILPTSRDEIQYYATADAYIKSTSLEMWQMEGHTLENHAAAYQNLAELGVPVVPFELYQDENNFYVVAARVEGVPAGELLATDPELAAEYDQVMATTIAAVAQLRGTDEYFPADIFGNGQFMVGNLAGHDAAPQLFFVDIEPTSGGIVIDGRSIESEESYSDLLRIVAWALIDDEEQHSIHLEQARLTLLSQFSELAENPNDPRLMQSRYNAIVRALETNNRALLDSDDF